MRAALLARVSDASQATSDRHSLPAQVSAMRERCTREGWDIVRTFEAPGESAYTRDINRRPVLRDLLDAAKRREFEVVLFHETSRVARDEEMAFRLLNDLEALGILLVESSRPTNYYHEMEGRVMYGINASLNRWQSSKHGAQVAKGKRERFEKGLHVGNLAFGYRMQLRPLPDGTVEVATELPALPVPEEAVAIKEAFKARASGVGPQEIATRLNAAGFRPHSQFGNPVFTTSAAQSILENDFYCGFIHHLGQRGRGAHETILSEDEWMAAQIKIAERRRTPRAREPRALTGLAVCAECRGPLWLSRSGTNHTYYRETSKLRQRACPNQRTGWKAAEAEEIVGQVISSMALDERWWLEVDREARRPQVEDDGKARSTLQEERRRVAHAYRLKSYTPAEFERIVGGIDEQLARLPSSAPSPVLFSGEKLRIAGQAWGIFSHAAKREACALLFQRVEMDTREKRLWLDPWPELEGFFVHRRQFILAKRPRHDSNLDSLKPWLYLASELVA